MFHKFKDKGKRSMAVLKCLFSGSYHNVYIHMIFQGKEFKEPVG